VNETPHATRIWKGTERKKGPEALMEPEGSDKEADDMMMRREKDGEVKNLSPERGDYIS
jgi:hypothetical protein